MTYRLNRAHLLISVFAGLVFAGIFVYRLFFELPHHLFDMAMWISLAIVIFYVIGVFARSFLIQEVFVPEEEYDFSQDEEYLAFMESLENDGEEIETIEAPTDVMLDDPADPFEDYDDSLNDPFIDPVPLDVS